MSRQAKVQGRAYAIVRVDLFQPESVPWTNRITVKAVVWNQHEAEQEVERLNNVNSGKGVLYFCQATRVSPIEPDADTNEGVDTDK
jgi:hypothetical protein